MAGACHVCNPPIRRYNSPKSSRTKLLEVFEVELLEPGCTPTRLVQRRVGVHPQQLRFDLGHPGFSR